MSDSTPSSPDESPPATRRRQLPSNDFALAAFQTAEQLEILVKALKEYDHARHLAWLRDELKLVNMTVVPWEKYMGKQGPNPDTYLVDYVRSREQQTPSASLTTLNDDDDDDDEAEEEMGSDEGTIVQASCGEERRTELEVDIEVEAEAEAEVESMLDVVEDNQSEEIKEEEKVVSLTPAEKRKKAKSQKRAERKKQKKQKTGAVEVDSSPLMAKEAAEAIIEHTNDDDESQMSTPKARPASPHALTDVPTVSLSKTGVQELVEEPERRESPPLDRIPDEPTLPLPLSQDSPPQSVPTSVNDNGVPVDGEGWPIIPESDGLVIEEHQMGTSPPPAESIRTEMTLVLDDESDGGRRPIVTSPPIPMPLTLGAPNFFAEQDEDDDITVVRLPRVHKQDDAAGAQEPNIPIIIHQPIYPAADFHSNEPGSDEVNLISQGRPHTPTPPQSPEHPNPPETVIGPERSKPRFSPPAKLTYPNPRHAPAVTLTVPVGHRVASHGRSPLAAAPPITPSTLPSPSASLQPTRQNTPVSGAPPPHLDIKIETASSAAHVRVPAGVHQSQPQSLDRIKLNYPYTLYASLSGGHTSPVPATTAGGKYPPDLSAASAAAKKGSADAYSSDLVPIFTADTFGDFFGKWKALRRKVAKLYGRLIEPEGMGSGVRGSEGLEVHLMSGSRTFQFFRQDVKPMWEDPMCAKGGKIMLTGRSDEVDQLFFRLVLSVVAGCFDVDCPPPRGTDAGIVGVVQSKRDKHSRLEVWLGGKGPLPIAWIKRVEAFLKVDVPGQWYAYKAFQYNH